ncbi:class I SAM-dependent methyltransferase [Leisingera sp. ANG-Vp]|uniref:class I SAM-dependent methyltransferase n=1 Tax=Leisingera sp. ANG-Vp TaxID=1577896 RepID=UPI00057FAC3D|nr:class I SAM-dependent methyltransferase [Leisingera sp. ANG-Vp]KIC13897.1 methylase [Leisingera sp. ANG-Vp]
MSEKSAELEMAVAANRAAWDASARLHHGNALWQELAEGFAKPGFSTFDATMTRTLDGLELQGLSGVQVGCNNGRETLSLAAFGAERCLGIDQSAEFLKQAALLKDIAGASCDFLCADIYALPDGIRRDFDFAVITIGVLGWMPDLGRFFQAVAGLLRPGGRLVIYETHPFLEMFEPESETPHLPAYSYFSTGPFVAEQAITYDGSAKQAAPPSYWHSHTLSGIVMALIRAGLQVSRFEEHAHSNRETCFDVYENQEAQLPMSFTLVARREDG